MSMRRINNQLFRGPSDFAGFPLLDRNEQASGNAKRPNTTTTETALRLKLDLRTLRHELFDPRYRLFRRLAVATLVFVLFALLPIIIWFGLVKKPFTPIPTTCGGDPSSGLDTPNNTFSGGAESLFTVDRAFGRSPFWKAKFIDIVWDLGVARGMQFLAGWASYVALSSILLRAMESSSIPYNTSVGLILSGPSIATICSVIGDLKRFTRKRTVLLFAYIVLSMIYVVALPTLLTASTGYVSVSAAYATIPNTTQIVSVSEFLLPAAVLTNPATGSQYCLTYQPGWYIWDFARAQRQMACCRPKTCSRTCMEYGSSYDSCKEQCQSSDYSQASGIGQIWEGEQCTFYGNSTYFYPDPQGRNQSSNCNQTWDITYDNKSFDPWASLHMYSYRDEAICYNSQIYNLTAVSKSVQCLPDTGDPKYKWGFSTVLTSTVLLFHVTWAVCMFVMWLEAETYGSLQRENGFQLSQLRGAFIVAEAATKTTNLAVNDLISREPADTARMLRRKDAAVRIEMLREKLPLADIRAHDEA